MKTCKGLLTIAVLLALLSCEKELPTYYKFEGYEFDSQELTGGSWTPILLNSPDVISIPVPEAEGSTRYMQELEELKQLQRYMTDKDRKNLDYWSQNPIIRWNEIALELIAKYNLIPGPNEDGTYTLPNPSSPEGPPAFPFSHPPYAVRALAYLSVAQFDGLVTAWHYKTTHSRSSPYLFDSSISPYYAGNIFFSYPSESAVIARASKLVLSTMFPLEAEYLAEREADHLQSLSISGAFLSSDIEAGLIIGEAISELAIVRASNDGMKNAQTSKMVSDSIANAAFLRFGWNWENLEIPQRPVGLTPLFGKVRMWNVTNVEDTRPLPPPAIGSPEYLMDVNILKQYAENVTEETRRIANFWQDGIGTYTPPGHWNDIAKKYIINYRMNPLRSARTLAYLNMAMMDAGISCWDAKYYYHYPRPIQMISGFKTIAGTPNFPAYTSGHSVFSSSAAEILSYVFPTEAEKFRKWAEEAALSRVYGGIHWTFDAKVGTQQGKVVAEYTISRAKTDGAD